MIKYLKFIIPMLVIAAGTGFYLVNKPPKSLKKMKPDVELSATQLFVKFSEDENKANLEFLDKVVSVTGTIMEVKNDSENGFKLLLEAQDEMFGVSCEFDPSVEFDESVYKSGKTVTVKGLCTGVLMDVVLIRCFPN